jgi:hypothetical protein
MFAWLRSLLAVTPQRATAARPPFRFRPVLEYLGDRSLPSATVTHPVGDPVTVSTGAHRGDGGDQLPGHSAHVRIAQDSHPDSEHDRDSADRAEKTKIRGVVADQMSGDALARVVEGRHTHRGIDEKDEGRAEKFDPREEIADLQQAEDTLIRLAEEFRSGQGIDVTATDQAVVIVFQEEIVDHPLVEDALVRVADAVRPAQMIAGQDAVQLELPDSPEHSDQHVVAPPPTASSPPDPAPDRRVPFSQPPPVVPQLPEVQGERWVVAFSDRGEPSSRLPDPSVTPSDSLAPTVAPEPRAAAGAAPAAPTTVVPVDTEKADALDGAGIITRFIPFDTADLQQEVNNFLSALEPALPAVPEQLLPGEWGLGAAFVTGAGVILVVTKWRARVARDAPTAPPRQRSPGALPGGEPVG